MIIFKKNFQRNYFDLELYLSKPVIITVFQASENYVQIKSKNGHNFNGLQEYRFYCFTQDNFWNLIIFQQYQLDSEDEFYQEIDKQILGYYLMARWVQQFDDPIKVLKYIDRNAGSIILFDVFCQLAINKGLDLKLDNKQESNT